MQQPSAITNYSSVSWDFLYLNKPVLFYRFDLHRYLTSRGTYLPLDKPIFGDILTDASEINAALASTFNAHFVFTDEYQTYRDSIMPVIDRNNCVRILELANNLPSLMLP